MKKVTLFLTVAGCLLASCNDGGDHRQPANTPTPYITRVLEYMPAPGQFVNILPPYEDGDTQQTMNAKVLAAIGNNNRGTISLGGFGGYVVVGFDHTIENVPGLPDFRVSGNAMDAGYSANPVGNSEPGVISVAYDANKNGEPDDGEWYEIAGSAREDLTAAAWIPKAIAHGNDMNIYTDYEIAYSRNDGGGDILWQDNKGNSGAIVRNESHDQSYFPLWVSSGRMTFRGTRLLQNGVDKSGDGLYYVLYGFREGYADNAPNASAASAIDIDRAVDASGREVHLPGVDFIRIHTGVNQICGKAGECSTEITGIEDLHLTGADARR